MVQKIIVLFVFLWIGLALNAQPCDFPLPPSNTCQTAPLLCSLDGYCSNNGAAQNSGTPNAFCGQVENNNWVSFIAGSSEFELEVTVENCNNGQGLQAQFFGTNNCQTFTAVSNCLNPVNNVASVVASGLEIGTVYYLMMDGKNGDVCDYTYRLIQGTILSPAEAVIEDPGFLCGPDTLTLDATASGSGTSLTFEWSTTDGNIIGDPSEAIIFVDTPGTYQLLVKDAGGCEDMTEILVQEPPLASLNIEEPEILDCLNNIEITLSGTETTGLSVTYDWSTENGNIIAGADTQMPLVDAPGIYTLIVTNTITGCTETEEMEVFSSISTPVANAGADQELNCLNPTVLLNGVLSSFGNNFSYLWTSPDGRILNGATTNQAHVDLPGTYTLQVTNLDNDCVDIDEVMVVDNPAVPEGAFVDLDNPCYGEDFGKFRIDSVLGGIAPYTFALDSSTFASSNEFRRLAPGDYELRIKDATGCEWDTLIQVFSQPELIVDLGQEDTLLLGCSIEINAQINFPQEQMDTLIWQDGASCPGCYTQEDTLLNMRIYSVKVIDQNGCEAVDKKTVYVEKERLIFIPNIFTPNGDGINDEFMIYGGKDVLQVRTFRVFNRWGATLFTGHNFQPDDASFGWDGRQKGEDVVNGVYVYLAEVEFIDGRTILYKGDVALVR